MGRKPVVSDIGGVVALSALAGTIAYAAASEAQKIQAQCSSLGVEFAKVQKHAQTSLRTLSQAWQAAKAATLRGEGEWLVD